MPLTTKELSTIRVQAIYFATDHRFGPSMQEPSPIRILAELRGARFDVVHSQIAPTVLPHSQEDWQITDRATTDLLTAAGFTTRPEYRHACDVHGAAILNFYRAEDSMSEPRQQCITCGRRRFCSLHLRAEFPPAAAKQWLLRHCPGDKTSCMIRYHAGIEIQRTPDAEEQP